MKTKTSTIFRFLLACVMLVGQSISAEEIVYRVSAQPGQSCNEGSGCTPNINLGTIANMQLVSTAGTIPAFCYTNYVACGAALANSSNSFIVYRKDEIDTRTDAINSQIEVLGSKVNSLNRRMADDEAGLPAAVDQYAVQKLLEKINALEIRVKTLEGQIDAHKP